MHHLAALLLSPSYCTVHCTSALECGQVFRTMLTLRLDCLVSQAVQSSCPTFSISCIVCQTLNFALPWLATLQCLGLMEVRADDTEGVIRHRLQVCELKAEQVHAGWGDVLSKVEPWVLIHCSTSCVVFRSGVFT